MFSDQICKMSIGYPRAKQENSAQNLTKSSTDVPKKKKKRMRPLSFFN